MKNLEDLINYLKKHGYRESELIGKTRWEILNAWMDTKTGYVPEYEVEHIVSIIYK